MSAVRTADVEMVRAQLRTIVQGAIEGTGDLAASVARLAEIVESLLPPEPEPERVPVPYKDYLPDLMHTACGWRSEQYAAVVVLYWRPEWMRGHMCTPPVPAADPDQVRGRFRRLLSLGRRA